MKRQLTKLCFLFIGIFSMISVMAQPGFTNIYLIGDASPSGWNIGAPTAVMIQDQLDANIFTWEGPLTAGELKFSTFTGNWCDGQWLNSPLADGVITETGYIYTTGCDGPDNKWRILAEEAGNYKVTINLMNETITFLKLSNDASLASISVSVGFLSPLFDAVITQYTLAVPDGTTTVDITAQPNDVYAGITGQGSVDVSSGSGTATIIVTSADGSATLSYVIDITVSDPYFANLYLVGSATPSGWNIGTPEPMVRNEADTMVFTWEGNLIAGELKFSTFTGDWCDGIWLNASQADQVLFATDFVYRVGCDGADNKWLVSADVEGTYLIRINLRNKSISIESPIHDTELESLTISPGTLSPVFDGLITSYTAVLPVGTTSVNVDAMERSIGAGVTGTGIIDVSSGSATATITVTAPDGYLTKKYTIDFTVNIPYYKNLYLLGSATSAGWNVGSPVPMIQSESDSMIFNWKGQLTEGEFKISTFSGDWCDGAWIKPSVNSQVLTATDFIYTNGCDAPDNKWAVLAADAGEYLVTVNLKNKTISISSTTGVINPGKLSTIIYPNPAKDVLNINIGNTKLAKLSIYTIDGHELYKTILSESISSIDLGSLNSSGILIVKVSSEKAFEVFKIVVE